jgi:hypothetical protein
MDIGHPLPEPPRLRPEASSPSVGQRPPPLRTRCGAATLVAEPTARGIQWRRVDVMPVENDLIKRNDVYSDSVSIVRQVGLLS